MKNRRVVITGMSVYTPIGMELETFWKNSLKGVVGYDAYEDDEICEGEKKILGLLPRKKFDLENEDEMGRPAYLALNSAIEAVNMANLDLNCVDRQKVGVCIANAISNTPFCEKVYRHPEETYSNIYEKGMFSFISYEISKYFDIKGSSMVISTGCTGGIDAIGYAYENIREGVHDIMICGGVETPIANMTIRSFEAIGALAKGFEKAPQSASRPFDIGRNGFVLSEGCAMLVLEDFDIAVKRGATIYGEILSYESCNNAYHMTDLLNDGSDLAHIIMKALQEAKIEASMIDYINAHGSSTWQNDIFETEAYKKAFGEYAYRIPISSTKSVTGHPLAAASAIETVHTVLALQNNIVPPTINIKETDEKTDLNYVSNTPLKKNIRYALTNANGFSGLHSVLVLTKGKE